MHNKKLILVITTSLCTLGKTFAVDTQLKNRLITIAQALPTEEALSLKAFLADAQTPDAFVCALDETMNLLEAHEEHELPLEIKNKCIEEIEEIISDLCEDETYAKVLEEHYNFDDEELTRSRKNKKLKNLCVKKNVKINGNLCVAGKALFKQGVLIPSNAGITITAPLVVDSVTAQTATVSLASATTVNVQSVRGLMGVSSPQAGTYPVSYDPTTGYLYYQT